MVQLKLPHRPEQRSLLAACTTSSPKPAATVRRAHASEVLAELRADNSLTMAAMLAESESIIAARHARQRALFDEDRRRREDALAAAWVSDAVARMLAENVEHVRETLATRPELAHKHEVLMELTPVVAQLKTAAALPVADWSAQLADAFAPEVSAR
jgi:hypothetical protein